VSARFKHLGDLSHLREQLAERARAHEREARAIVARQKRAEQAASNFRQAMQEIGGVRPLAPQGRHDRIAKHHPPHPEQRLRDEKEVLASSVSDEIDIDSLLDTDDSLSFRRPGVGPDILRKLRRGEWSIQDRIDLHGHRVDEAREALVEFLRDALKRGLRCVRVVHGKGLGSKDRRPVLKDKVRAWLAQRDEVIAFCQARPAEGGGGALIILLRPTTSAKPAS
jgi:DNA-nicking Smr family endonuclease